MISTYADEIKSDSAYDAFKPWHYVNFKDNETYEQSDKSPKGDLIVGIRKCKEVLSNPNALKKDKVFLFKDTRTSYRRPTSAYARRKSRGSGEEIPSLCNGLERNKFNCLGYKNDSVFGMTTVNSH